jgi:N-acetylneuraminic acid mutarotase
MKVKKIVIFVLIVEFDLALGSLAEEGTWTTRSPLPTATSLHSASVIDGKIYVIGGTDTIYRVATDYFSTVLMYDPTTDTWTMKADMPRGRARAATCVVNGKIYAIGGSPHGDADFAFVEMYDPATDTWTRKADLPRARCFLSASAVNNKIYVIGGKIYPSATMVATVEEYDPATNTWTRKTDMPTARGCHSASVVDGKIYVIGGATGAFGPVVSTVEVYDPVTDTWTKKADMPTARFFISTSVMNGKIYTFGGGNDWAPSLSTVEVYDPKTDTWSKQADMPIGKATHSASVVDGKIYVIGGTLGIEPWVPTATVEVYKLNPPVVDFNGNGLLDINDLLKLIESWGKDDTQCDLAPLPFGDGIVDALDLELLMNYWQQPVDDPTLIAHWALDEAEGTFAYDSAGVNDAVVVGGTEWQQRGGQVDGALHFDGVSGCAISGPVLNPANGPFSVFAWINGGAPGQAVVSQQIAANWLALDSEGNLMTELKCTGCSAGPLFSETVITDGQWHRIGLVWDGLHRTLYVDGVVVAEDTQNELMSSNNSLYIGCGSNSTAGTFFSGLIDDVRIYNRVVSP